MNPDKITVDKCESCPFFFGGLKRYLACEYALYVYPNGEERYFEPGERPDVIQAWCPLRRWGPVCVEVTP